jgi:hypothetical protein
MRRLHLCKRRQRNVQWYRLYGRNQERHLCRPDCEPIAVRQWKLDEHLLTGDGRRSRPRLLDERVSAHAPRIRPPVGGEADEGLIFARRARADARRDAIDQVRR